MAPLEHVGIEFRLGRCQDMLCTQTALYLAVHKRRIEVMLAIPFSFQCFENIVVWIYARLQEGERVALSDDVRCGVPAAYAFQQGGGSHKGEYGVRLPGDPYPEHFRNAFEAARYAAAWYLN
jgi:hypothetical protein